MREPLTNKKARFLEPYQKFPPKTDARQASLDSGGYLSLEYQDSFVRGLSIRFGIC